MPTNNRSKPNPELIVSIHERVARITIARASRRNALDSTCWQSLTDACADIAQHNDVAAVVLTGEGEHFSAGADIHEMREHIADAAWMADNQNCVGVALDAYANLPQPTIALIRGSCYGGGCALAVSSDFRIAANDCRMAIAPAKLGLTYRLVDCLRLHELIGPAPSREMLLLAREIDGETAMAWGMVTEVASADLLDTKLNAMIEKLCALSSYSQRSIKATLRKIRDGQTADDAETKKIFNAAFSGADFMAAAEAFKKNKEKE